MFCNNRFSYLCILEGVEFERLEWHVTLFFCWWLARPSRWTGASSDIPGVPPAAARAAPKWKLRYVTCLQSIQIWFCTIPIFAAGAGPPLKPPPDFRADPRHMCVCMVMRRGWAIGFAVYLFAARGESSDLIVSSCLGHSSRESLRNRRSLSNLGAPAGKYLLSPLEKTPTTIPGKHVYDSPPADSPAYSSPSWVKRQRQPCRRGRYQSRCNFLAPALFIVCRKTNAAPKFQLLY